VVVYEDRDDEDGDDVDLFEDCWTGPLSCI
jgi:hypothetical protein